jgi:hypothetical protein
MPDSMMDFLSRATEMMENLPDPLVYTIIAVFTSGAVYSSYQHARNWRPRKARRVKLKGADGKKIEDCAPPAPHSRDKLTECSIDVMESWSIGRQYKLQRRVCVSSLLKLIIDW